MKTLTAVIVLVLFPACVWAACSPSRLEGKHPPLVYVLEKALDRQAWDTADLRDFLESPEWYNPFTRVRYSDLRSRFIEAFNQIDASMNDSQRAEVKASMGILLSAIREDKQVERVATETTQYVYSPRPLMTLELSGFSTDPKAPVAQGFRHGRPVFVSYGSTQDGNQRPVIFDPFNPDAAQRAFVFGEPRPTMWGPAKIFNVDGKSYVTFPTELLVYELESLKDVSAQFAGQTLPPKTPDRAGSREILWTIAEEQIEFRDMSHGRAIKPFPNKILYNGATKVHDVRVFEADGKLVAAVRYSVMMGSTRPRHVYYEALVEVGTENVIQRLPMAVSDSRFKVSSLEPITIDGRTWILSNHINEMKQTVARAYGARTDDYKTFPIEDHSEADVASFVWREMTYLVFADQNKITFLEEATGTRITVEDPGGTDGKRLKVFEYNHALYLAVHSYPLPPRIIQITVPSRGSP